MHQLKKMMGGTETAKNGHSTQAAPPTSSGSGDRGPQAIQRVNHPPHEAAFGSAMPSAIATSMPPTNTALAPTTVEERAIHAIMTYNHHPGRSHEEKWLISTPVLMEVIRAHGLSTSQKSIRAALDRYQHDIQHHHQFHQLGVPHNTKHKGLHNIKHYGQL